MSGRTHICQRCGHSSGRFGRWVHTYFGWNIFESLLHRDRKTRCRGRETVDPWL